MSKGMDSKKSEKKAPTKTLKEKRALKQAKKGSKEGMELLDFTVERCVPRFLPYTMVRQRPVPMAFVRLFLKVPWLWWTVGKQFLVVARAGA